MTHRKLSCTYVKNISCASFILIITYINDINVAVVEACNTVGYDVCIQCLTLVELNFCWKVMQKLGAMPMMYLLISFRQG